MEFIIFLAVVWVLWLFFRKGGSLPASSAPPSSPEITIRVTTERYPAENIRRDLNPDQLWVPSGRAVTLHGRTLQGGLVYVGAGLAAPRGWGLEASLIDPDLPVDFSGADLEGVNMDYWPSYSNMHPASRAAYLLWLEGGRMDPGTNIGYVFLYFYGLERRLLVDAKQSTAARSEAGAIVSEVRRLVEVYGDNHSFRGYAGRFLESVEFPQARDYLYKQAPPTADRGYELPIRLKVGLAQVALHGVPLPADWALAWIEADPEASLRTPAQRCPSEFRALFQQRFIEKFGEGCRIKPNKTRLSVHYRAASPSLGQVAIPVGDLPDVTVIKQPIEALRKIADQCVTELDPYSRYLGRNPGQENSLAAMALLPQPLLALVENSELQKLQSWLAVKMGDKSTVIEDMESLLQASPTFGDTEFGRREALALAQLLEKFGVGMEPDGRFGSPVAKTGKVVLFPLVKGAPQSPSPQYGAASVILHLAALVSGADGSVSPEEEVHLEQQLESWLHLNQEERTRLRAHTQWLLSSAPGFAGVKKRLEQLDAGKKRGIARFLVTMAQADGVIDPTEIKILTKIYGLLGLDAQELYSHAHAAATDPVTVRPPEAKGQGYAVPPAPASEAPSGGALRLDMDQVQAKLAETATVSAMLRNIFSEEDAPMASPQAQGPKEKSVAGLDPQHSSFMKTLSVKLSWTRAELEELAARLDLLLDGALETLNEAAFDVFDEPFFEGEDPIEINANIAKEVSP